MPVQLRYKRGCHVVSSIAGRRFLLDDGEKEILPGMVREHNVSVWVQKEKWRI